MIFGELLESYILQVKIVKYKNRKLEKALEEACKRIADAAEPNCGNCPLQNGKCPNCEDITERCWEFIKDYFVKNK